MGGRTSSCWSLVGDPSRAGGETAGTTFPCNASGGSTAFGSTFGGKSVNGTWTLFFADLSGGDGANVSTLDGWSLEFTAVPEPVYYALGVFGPLFSLAGLRNIFDRKPSRDGVSRLP